MRNVDAHLLGDKMDEAVTHYINTHQSGETVHVDTSSLSLTVQDDGEGRVVTVMHPPQYSTQMHCRSTVVGETVESGTWTEAQITEQFIDEGKLAALVAHLAHNSRGPSQPHHKVLSVRDVESSVMLDNRIFNGQSLVQEQQSPPIVVEVPHMPPLPPLQEMKRCDSGWFTKNKTAHKDDAILELNPGASPAQHKQQSKKSLPHKKRISKKLKRNTGNSTPQQDLVVINCPEDEVQQEQILPDNFVPGVQHAEAHHIAHEVRPILICQLCGEFYGEEQLKFYQHLKQHYEPHGTIIIENPVPDLGIDKMTNTCIVDNVATLPDSIVELSLENTVPKTMYQTDKHILYTTSDKTLNFNKVQYSIANIDKEVHTHDTNDKADIYDTLQKLDEVFCCTKCNKAFRKQKQCEVHIKEAHSNKLEDMSEFSEPEDLMEGIHVSVDEPSDQYDHTLVPHLTVENGHVRQDQEAHWYTRNGPCNGLLSCGGGSSCPVCAHPPPPPAIPSHQLKEEVIQGILEREVQTETANYTESIIRENNEIPDHEHRIPNESSKPQEQPQNNVEQISQVVDKSEHLVEKKAKKFECQHCTRVFSHRNSLLYHVLSHKDKQHICRICQKQFYTIGALKVHFRIHNGERPHKCESCGQEFRQWSDLKYHKDSFHSDAKNFKCEFCGKEFARKYSLRVHRRIHTGEKNYKCDYCNKCFSASSYRLTHMRVHTGDKPYKCEECGKSFRTAGDLRRHTLVHSRHRNSEGKQKFTKDKKKSPQIKTESDKLKELIKTEQHGDDVPNTGQKEQTKVVRRIATASTTARMPQKCNTLEKKPKSTRKNQALKKVSAPNVIVMGQKVIEYKHNDNINQDLLEDVKYKLREYANNLEESKTVVQKNKTDFNEVQSHYKENDRLHERLQERDITKSVYKTVNSDEKPIYRNDTTDGKIPIYNSVDKPEVDFGHPVQDGRHARGDMHGEGIETAFLERLTAMYNIPA